MHALPLFLTLPNSPKLEKKNNKTTRACTLHRAAAFVSEAVGTLDRRLAEGDTSPWFRSSLYPPYYMANTFHYQTDGWLSAR